MKVKPDSIKRNRPVDPWDQIKQTGKDDRLPPWWLMLILAACLAFLLSD